MVTSKLQSCHQFVIIAFLMINDAQGHNSTFLSHFKLYVPLCSSMEKEINFCSKKPTNTQIFKPKNHSAISDQLDLNLLVWITEKLTKIMSQESSCKKLTFFIHNDNFCHSVSFLRMKVCTIRVFSILLQDLA